MFTTGSHIVVAANRNATGTLLGAAFLGMLPKALEKTPPLAITGTVLDGIATIALFRFVH